jgi:hypothetical protein
MRIYSLIFHLRPWNFLYILLRNKPVTREMSVSIERANSASAGLGKG